MALAGSSSETPDMSDVRTGGGSDPVAPIGRRGTDFGAPAVRDPQSGSLLTVAELARRLGVCRATVYRMCATGRLRHVRVSNAIRVPERALRAFLDGANSR